MAFVAGGLSDYSSSRAIGVPLDWAMAQNNLGTAPATLGTREAGTARLEEAVTAYPDGLLEREGVPLNWALTQNNLGTALRLLEERRQSPDT